jgi:hypothetical protein
MYLMDFHAPNTECTEYTYAGCMYSEYMWAECMYSDYAAYAYTYTEYAEYTHAEYTYTEMLNWLLALALLEGAIVPMRCLALVIGTHSP